MRRTFIIHPFLFGLFPILAFLAHNIKELSVNVIIFPSMIILSLTFISWVLISISIKNTKKAGLIVSLSIMMFFSYGHFINPIIDFKLYGILIGRHLYFLSIWSMIIIGGIYLIVKTNNNFYIFTRRLNIVSAFLVMISLVQIGGYELRTRSWKDYSNGDRIIGEEKPLLRSGDELHDIYYIILDAYASNKTLKEYYNYDNSEFTDFMIDKGFYVAHESKANYPNTRLSLASSLNMKYLNYLSQIFGEESTDRRPLYKLIRENTVLDLLKSLGYKYIHLGSWWGPTRSSKYADININYGMEISELSTNILKYTMVHPVIRKFQNELLNRKRFLYKLKKLSEIPDIEGPKFIFAHMLITHTPFVFGKKGEPLTRSEAKKRGEDVNYLNQLIYVTHKLKLVVSNILAKSKTPPIIIIQSDHGPGNGEYIDEKGLINDIGRKRVRIINAYYMPKVSKDILYPTISPVNTFRIIFNLYFNSEYSLLKDETYITPNNNYPYRFVNVTSLVK